MPLIASCVGHGCPVAGCHRGKTDDWPMMSRQTYVFNCSFVSHQDLSEYVGPANIKQGVHGEPALKNGYKT